jgi:chromate reductase, NAD(P)H dehydrogenase (quinone)
MANQESSGFRITVIQGSVREGSFTGKAVALLLDELRQQKVAADFINPAEMDLPFPGLGAEAPGPVALRKTVSEATGVIFATPEYHGSFSSIVKLVIENLGFPSVLAGKPVSLLGVAAGRIGAIKSLEHLRGVCSHVGALVLPSLVSVANIQSVFDSAGHCQDPVIERQIRSVATNLLAYIHGHICPRITLERMIREQTAGQG